MSRIDEKKAEKRRRIVAACRELFARHGFDATTTRAIAAHAGIAHGTLFRYAPTRTDLLLMLFMDSILMCLDEALAEASPDAPIMDQFLAAFRSFFRLYERDGELSLRFIQATLFVEGERGHEYAQMNITFARIMGERVRAAQQRGEVRTDIEPVEMVRAAFAMYTVVLYDWIRQPPVDASVATAQLERALALLLDGYAAR